MCLSSQRSYPAAATTPAAARTFAHAMVVAGLEPSGWFVADDIEVIVSELVTEAVAALPNDIRVAVDVHYDRLHISLAHDGAPPNPRAQDDPAAVLREHVLDALASNRDVTAEAGGLTKNAAEVLFDPRHTASLSCQLRPATEPARERVEPAR